MTLGPEAVGLDVVADAEADQQVGQWLVRLRLTDKGIDRFNELAGRCYQGAEDCLTHRVAIVVGGRIRSAPTITNSRYEADQIQVSGDFSGDDARELADFVAG